MKIEKRDGENEREIRTLKAAGLELRADGDAKTYRVTGYAAVFDEETDLGYFSEVIRAGAFKNALSRGDDVRFLINHTDLPLARTASSTLKLTEDARGLKMEATLSADDPDVMRIVPKMQRGDLNQMSFAFTIAPDGEYVWHEKGEGENVKYLREIIRVGTLYDVAVVTYPAYEGTEIALRSLEAARKTSAPGDAQAGLIRRKMSLALKSRRIG